MSYGQNWRMQMTQRNHDAILTLINDRSPRFTSYAASVPSYSLIHTHTRFWHRWSWPTTRVIRIDITLGLSRSQSDTRTNTLLKINNISQICFAYVRVYLSRFYVGCSDELARSFLPLPTKTAIFMFVYSELFEKTIPILSFWFILKSPCHVILLPRFPGRFHRECGDIVSLFIGIKWIRFWVIVREHHPRTIVRYHKRGFIWSTEPTKMSFLSDYNIGPNVYCIGLLFNLKSKLFS